MELGRVERVFVSRQQGFIALERVDKARMDTVCYLAYVGTGSDHIEVKELIELSEIVGEGRLSLQYPANT